ncbi:hypothetical protein SAMN05216496_2274 [Pseudomonas sp. Z003-0.4C(8344-21)]|uniref:hypothetical protein n=1 Tax=Pseudomonas sp. Z003-0.4C(8344-21) TaxID=1855380 RepID=UPI00087A1A43|nr:hypothetical protein [Pseudomonas sp. Z003-0.4C(8344-21)]SDS73197.1 hypothetical protein SAMN05216496_2274 [Pseudomonas sp. Z003-0.4C(8344-21)]
MSIDLALLVGAVAAASSVIPLLKPLVSAYFKKKKKKSITVSINVGGVELRTVELHGETGKEAIEMLLKNLPEVKNGVKAVEPK